ncbi:MAG: hypothetical protein LBD56_01180 [Endomicrobium sp.]|jgi:hypothetical protein|nr:hypothetical protein [Endomicrobium sp.]
MKKIVSFAVVMLLAIQSVFGLDFDLVEFIERYRERDEFFICISHSNCTIRTLGQKISYYNLVKELSFKRALACLSTRFPNNSIPIEEIIKLSDASIQADKAFRYYSNSITAKDVGLGVIVTGVAFAGFVPLINKLGIFLFLAPVVQPAVGIGIGLFAATIGGVVEGIALICNNWAGNVSFKEIFDKPFCNGTRFCNETR